MPELFQAVQLLQASVDEDDESHFRFLIEGKFVKYVTVAVGLYAADDMCFAPALIPLLPPFPYGDWNDGYVARNPENGQPYFARAIKKQLPSVKSAWHPTHVDHLELALGKKLRSGIYEATSPRFRFTVVAKFARFAWEIDALENECMAYQWIEGQSIGPKFLGHLTEDGRVIGFLMEMIANARHATEDDLGLCQKTLAKLHQLGIVHGDVNKHNFLIGDGHATLIDFECARKSEDKRAFKEEMRSLLEQLSDTSGKGGNHAVDGGT